MSDTLKPRDAEELRTLVEWAAAESAPLELIGTGTKRGLGRPLQTMHSVDLSGLAGVTLYEPEELVLSARAGTRLAEIERLLAENRQQLAFEPGDLGPFYGKAAGQGTIGGVIACNLAGPRRIKAGSARDHFLGLAAVNGRGELFKSGGRVVKNVTGYDLCKLLAGSHGTLAALTDITLKVLPVPEKTRTLLAYGLDDATGIKALTSSIASAHEVSGAAHLPRTVAARSAVAYVKDTGAAVTAVRVEGFPASVEHRAGAIKALLAAFGPVEELHGRNSSLFWGELRDITPFARDLEPAVWRLSVPPVAGPAVAARIAAQREIAHFFDWGGGLVWIATSPTDDAGASLVRASLDGVGGHATLMRAPDGVRAAVPPFQPTTEGIARLSARVKESFDPRAIFNPGRMHAGI